VAVMTVMTVVVVAVVVMMAVVVVMMAVVVMTMAMTAVPAASRRVTRGGERSNGQRDGSSSGSQDSTLHFRLLQVTSRATIALACVRLVP
jgi:hypothetical protein